MFIISHQAAFTLGIKYSTAKTVLRIFRKEGRSDKIGTRKKYSTVKVETKKEWNLNIINKEDHDRNKALIDLLENNVFYPLHSVSQESAKSKSNLADGFWAEMITSHMRMRQISLSLR